jgi:hypothetical protein
MEQNIAVEMRMADTFDSLDNPVDKKSSLFQQQRRNTNEQKQTSSSSTLSSSSSTTAAEQQQQQHCQQPLPNQHSYQTNITNLQVWERWDIKLIRILKQQHYNNRWIMAEVVGHR